MAPALIGLEEHFVGEAVLNSNSIPEHMFVQAVQEKLCDLDKQRIEDMDRGSMMVQVVSHIPLVSPLHHCRAANDQLAAAITRSQGRLKGLGFLPMAAPEAIPGELERCVKSLGFVGALIPNHAHGQYYDAPAYWPMFAKAQDLDVPIYLHPTTTENLEHYAGNYDAVSQSLIAGPALGWHADVATHVLRLYASGVFDAYPRVKILLGHNGESMPFMLDRIHRRMQWAAARRRDFLTVWDENIWITTSGMYHLAPLQLCLRMCKPDRVLYSVDYPFDDTKTGLDFMEEVQKSGLVTQEQFDMICRGNAQKLLRI